MSEQLTKEGESGKATKVSFLTKARRFFGGGVAFTGGGIAYIGAEGNNWPVTAIGGAITLAGVLLAGIGWVRGEKK